MSQLWAVVAADGSYVLRYTSGPEISPLDDGHRAECRNRAVWPLTRAPDRASGEGVSYSTGEIDFALTRVVDVLVAELKVTAARKIEAIAPLWRQINDLHDAASAEVIDRRLRIDQVRLWSNAAEVQLRAIAGANELKTFMAGIRT